MYQDLRTRFQPSKKRKMPSIDLSRTCSWRDVPGFDGLFEINDLGQCRKRRFRDKSGRIQGHMFLVVKINDETGYASFQINRRTLSMAVMVLSLFNRFAHEGELPHHKNGDLSDCRIENLEWINEKDATYIERAVYGRVPIWTS